MRFSYFSRLKTIFHQKFLCIFTDNFKTYLLIHTQRIIIFLDSKGSLFISFSLEHSQHLLHQFCPYAIAAKIRIKRNMSLAVKMMQSP